MNYEALEEIRKHRGLSRRQLAKEIEVSNDTLTAAITRKSQTSILNTAPMITKLSAVLRMPVEAFLLPSELERIKHFTNDDELGALLGQLSFSAQPGDGVLDVNFHKLVNYYKKLNRLGRATAVQRLMELSELPRYQESEQVSEGK